MRRQDAPAVYEMNASIYIFKRQSLIKTKLLNNKTTLFMMPRERSVDIDDIYDLNLVKLLIKNDKNYLDKFNLKTKTFIVVVAVYWALKFPRLYFLLMQKFLFLYR